LKEKRRFMIYYAVTLCCDPPSCTELIQDKKTIEKILSKSDMMFAKFHLKS